MGYLRRVSICGLVVASLALPATAQSERYPTDIELQHLVQELRQSIADLQASGIYDDRRTPAEQQAISAFADAWAEVDPAIAPFLGEWTAIEESLYIYPAATRGEVCILDIYLDDGDFYTGQVRNSRVYTDQNLVFLLDSGYLGSTFVYDDQPGIYEYAHPRPLPDPSEALRQYYPEAVAAFEEAGCLVGIPQ
jgi:hypothetical protein